MGIVKITETNNSDYLGGGALWLILGLLIYDNFSYRNSQIFVNLIWGRFCKCLNLLEHYKQLQFTYQRYRKRNSPLYSPHLNNSRKLFFQKSLGEMSHAF